MIRTSSCATRGVVQQRRRRRRRLFDFDHVGQRRPSGVDTALCNCATKAECQRRRCRSLERTESDPRRLRSLSGAWFTEECSKRHRAGSASALVHASIRHRRTRSRGSAPPSPHSPPPQADGRLTSSPLCSGCLLSASEAPLTELFNGETEKDPRNGEQNRSAAEAERRLEASRDEESEGSVRDSQARTISGCCYFFFLLAKSLNFVSRSQASLKPVSTPRARHPRAKVHILSSVFSQLKPSMAAWKKKISFTSLNSGGEHFCLFLFCLLFLFLRLLKLCCVLLCVLWLKSDMS